MLFALIIGLVIGYYVGFVGGKDTEWKKENGFNDKDLSDNQISTMVLTRPLRYELGKQLIVGSKAQQKEALDNLTERIINIKGHLVQPNRS